MSLPQPRTPQPNEPARPAATPRQARRDDRASEASFRLWRVPLAFHNLFHDKMRLAVAVGGVLFAVVLMFMQLGFWNATVDSAVLVIERVRADLFLTSNARYALPAPARFDRHQLTRAESDAGVRSAAAVYIETASLLKSPNKKPWLIRVIAFTGEGPYFEPAVVDADLAQAFKQPYAIMVDTRSRLDKYGLGGLISGDASDATNAARLTYQGELNGESVNIVGTFELSTDLANDGNVLMTAENFARMPPAARALGDPLKWVDLGVVHVEENHRIEDVQRRLQRLYGEELVVLTKDELVAKEAKHWTESVPAGGLFSVGLVMGFLVGVVICYQIIYTDIARHMGEFATLKAMGYGNGYFLGMVTGQAVYLSVLGFAIGLPLSLLLYGTVAEQTGLIMELTFGRGLLIFVVTLTMCFVSGCLAMRKLIRSDPAEQFS